MFVLRRVKSIKRIGTVILNMKISLVSFQNMGMTSLKLQKKKALIRFFLEPLLYMKQLMEHGFVTIEQLGEIYAPVGAANDPNNLNQHWIPTMEELTKNLGGLTMNCEAESQIDADLMDGKSWIAPHTKTITSGFGYRTGC